MTGHLGLCLRLGLRISLSDAEVLETVQRHLPGGMLIPISPARWALAGCTTLIGQMLLLRRTWAGGAALQLDWLLSDEAYRQLRYRGRYLGEDWLLRVTESLLLRGAAAIASLGTGSIWEEGAVDELESLDLPGFDGALLLGPRLSEALDELLCEPKVGLHAWSVDAGTWLCNHRFETAWAAWPKPGAPTALPWMWLPEPETLDFDDGSEVLQVHAIGQLPASNEAIEAALADFLVCIGRLGGRLATQVPVLYRGARRTLSEPALRLLLAAHCQRQLGHSPPISGLDALHARPEQIANLQWQLLRAVYLSAPQGQVVFMPSDAQHSRISLAFLCSAGTHAWQRDAWRLPWIEALAAYSNRPEK